MKVSINQYIVIVLAVSGYSAFEFIDGSTVNAIEVDVSNNNSNFVTYKDNDFGFEVQYPANWEPSTDELEYGPVIFDAPDGHANVIMKVINREKNETLKQFGDRFFKNNDAFNISEYYRNENTTFVGLPSIKTTGTYSYNPTVFEQLRGKEGFVAKVLWDIALVENKDAFFGIAYFADSQSSFNMYLPTVQRMIDSVKLNDKQSIFHEED